MNINIHLDCMQKAWEQTFFRVYNNSLEHIFYFFYFFDNYNRIPSVHVFGSGPDNISLVSFNWHDMWLSAEQCRLIRIEYFIWQINCIYHLLDQAKLTIHKHKTLVLINSIKLKRIFVFNDLSNSSQTDKRHSIDSVELLSGESWTLSFVHILRAI